MQYKWTALTVTSVGTLMAGIQSRILIIGLPTVARQLQANAAEVIWISLSFQLAATVSFLMIGRVSDIYGRAKLYNIGFVVFTIGAILSAISLNVYMLIGFQVVQGFGAAILGTTSGAIIADASPKDELGTLLGINQTAFRGGAMAGLTISGFVLSLVNWRGLFYMNVPIGIFGTIWAFRRLREIAPEDPEKRIDWLGIGLFSGGLALLLLGVTYLSYGVSSALESIGFIVSGVVLILVFARVESRTAAPVVDISLFKIKVLVMGNIAQTLYSASWAGLLLIFAIFLQIILGYTPFQAGLGVLPIEVSYLPISILAGRISDRYGSRTLTSSGLALGAAGLFILSTFGQGTPYLFVALDLVLIGIGSGLFVTPNSRAVIGSVPPNRRGVASGLFSTAFNVGSAIGFGLTILFMTFGIPYASLSFVLQGTAAQAGVAALRGEFLNGIKIASLIFALIQTASIFPSLARGAKETRVV
ncbi:MAG: MFS transporter [Nitrososphaerota archaeon]|nr:MFS transporter [Nitrososphaerota archaeon]MDG6923334.1 MFS transporter [Nitrososphaerota archaeon]